MTIGEKILLLIKEKGITQREFARLTNIPETTVSDWRAKRLNPSSDKILKICEVLEVSPYALLSASEVSGQEAPESITVFQGSDAYDLLRAYQKLGPAGCARMRGYLDYLSQDDK